MNGNNKMEIMSFSILPPDRYGSYLPCPEVLTEEEAIRFLRLDIDGPKRPERTLQYYREKGLLRATRVGKRLRYQKTELLALINRLTERTQKGKRLI